MTINPPQHLATILRAERDGYVLTRSIPGKYFSVMLRSVLMILMLLAASITLNAQNHTIRGLILDHSNGQPLEMAHVILQTIGNNNERRTTTDNNGLFELRRLNPGNYVFHVRFVGYEPHSDTLRLTNEQLGHALTIRLRPINESLDEIVVSGYQQIDIQRPGQFTLRSEDFKRVPTPAGSADLMGYLQSQPGVVVAGDRGGQLFIRGGLPSENMVLMDGSLVFQPFHIIGFFSIFPEEVVSKADLYAGGFGPRFSGRTSSVMDVQLRNANLYERKWSASISPYLASAFYESPVRKGSSSFFVSARGSLIEQASTAYLSEKQPLLFNSQLIKYSSVSEEGFNCSAHMLRTYDRGQLDYTNGAYFKWGNIVAGGRCAGVSQESSVSYMEINVGISYMNNEVGSRVLRGRSSSVLKSQVDVNLIQNFDRFRFDYGGFVNFHEVGYDISDLFVGMKSNDATIMSAGLHGNLHIPLGSGVSIDPGMVATTYFGFMKPSVEPRVQASWSPRNLPNERLNLAWGIYRQPLVGISDFRDAGTAFTAYMPIPDDSRRQQAQHFLAGWHQPIGRYIQTSIEGYYKQIENVPVSVWSSVARFTTDLAYANGDVYGLDARISFNSRNFYGSMGYVYSWTLYTTAQDHFTTWFGEPITDYHPPQDRRHQLNVQTGYENRDYKVNISWIYGSGFPFTQPMGFDNYFDFKDHMPDFHYNHGLPRVIMEKAYRGRLPDFHRLDVSVERAFDLKSSKARVQGGVLNTYNWDNIFYFDVFNQNKIMQLPFMPYVALKIESK